MSAKSRARNRFEPPDEPTMDPVDQADLNEAMEAFDLAEINPRAGISKWVGAVLGARDRAQKDTVDDGLTPGKTGERAGERVGDDSGTGMPAPSSTALREPTPYELALLGGMAHKPMYGGTVEPWRVDERRRKNRRARKARRANRKAARQ